MIPIPFYTLFSGINLRNHPYLQLLQFNLHLGNEEMRKSQDDITQWFNSICESVTSKLLVVEVCEFSNEAEICNKIQDSLLGLNARIETLSVYLPNTNMFRIEVMKMDDVRKLFPKLYAMGIVTEKHLNEDGSVSCFFFQL